MEQKKKTKRPTKKTSPPKRIKNGPTLVDKVVNVKSVKVVDPGLNFKLEVVNDSEFTFNHNITEDHFTLTWQGTEYENGEIIGSKHITGKAPLIEVNFPEVDWALNPETTECPYSIYFNLTPALAPGVGGPTIQNPIQDAGTAPYNGPDYDKDQTN